MLKSCVSSLFAHSADRGPFYRKQLILDDPSSACEVKVSPHTKLHWPLFSSSHIQSNQLLASLPSCSLWPVEAAFWCVESSSVFSSCSPPRLAVPASTCNRCRVWLTRWGRASHPEHRTSWRWCTSSRRWEEMRSKFINLCRPLLVMGGNYNNNDTMS